MLSFIEMGFYLSLAVMLCLLFLLLNHLKGRILTLENQNEGLMDVMKMIRGNLVSADVEHKQLKSSVVSLAKNISVVSARIERQTQRILEASNTPTSENMVLEVEELYPDDDEDDEDEDDEDEDEDDATEPHYGKSNEIETVDIQWPSNEDIEIRKLASDAEPSDADINEIHRQIMEKMHTQSMFIDSENTSELQKIFFMMSMGNGIPMSNMRTVIFENGSGFGPSETQDEREYEILPDADLDADPEVEELPDSPMPELIPIDSIDDEALDYSQMNIQIDQLIDEIVVAVPEQKEGVVEDIPQPLVAQEMVPEVAEPVVDKVDDLVVEEMVPEVAEPAADEMATGPEVTGHEATEEEEEVAEKLPIDFSKMDVRTLRTLVSTQGKASAEKVSKMKKNDLIRILTSSDSASV